MRKSYLLFCAVSATLMAGAAQAVKPPITEAESADTNAARDAYATSRRASPYDVNFNSAAARLDAYNAFQSALPKGAMAAGGVTHAEHWQAIGPAPIVGGQTPTFNVTSRSLVTGRVTSIAIDATDNAVFIGGAQGGVWRTLNDGGTWTPLTDYLGSLAVGAIALDPAAHQPNQATLYLGTGEGNFAGDSYFGVGIYKSTNSGQTWSGPYGGALMTGRSVLTIAVDSTNSSVVLAGTSSGIAGEAGVTNPTLLARGIFRSTDGGVTWTKVTAGNNPVGKIAQDPNTPLRWWAAMSPVAPTALGGLLKSEDGGLTWAAVDGVATGLPAIAFAGATIRSNLTLTTATPGNASAVTLYFGTSQQTPTANNGRVYKSSDDGATWTHVTAAEYFCYPQCFYDQPLLVEPGAPNTFYTGGGGYEVADGVPLGLFSRSVDGGTTFDEKIRSDDGTTALHADMHAIATWPGQPNRIWVGNDGGVWRSDDRGDNWVDVNSNLALTQFSGCDLHPTQFGGALGGTQDNGTNAWLGTSAWAHSDDGDGGFAAIDHTTPTQVAHTYFNQTNNLMGVAAAYVGLAAGPNDYIGFAGAFTNDPNPDYNNGLILSDNVLFYAPFILDRNNTTTMYFGTNHLNKAVDFFNKAAVSTSTLQIYTQLNGGATITTAVPPSAYTGAISAIETVPSVLAGDSQIIFVGSDNGRVFRSVDSGATFQEVDAGGPLGLFVSNILVDPRNPQIVYQSPSGFSAGLPARNVRKSIDGGTTWNDAASGLPNVPVNAIAFDPAFPNQLWAGTDVGMYLSTDGGDSWIPYNEGIPNVAVFDVKSNPATHTVLACTHGRGAFILNTDAIFIDGFDGL